MARKQVYREPTKTKVERAKEEGLVTFKDIPGTKCSNCVWVKGDFCTNPKLKIKLPAGADRMCCNLWDNGKDNYKTYTEAELTEKGNE